MREPYTIFDIVHRDGWNCWICGSACRRPSQPWTYHGAVATIDHLVPLSLNGPDILANVKLAHHRCNSARGATFDLDRVQPVAQALGLRVWESERGIGWGFWADAA